MRKSAFDQEVALSAVMVDAIEAWLDAREGYAQPDVSKEPLDIGN